MDFVKKHYEKILLSVVLLGLAVATWLMSVKVDREKAELDELHGRIQKTPPKELPSLDLTNHLSNLPRLKNPKPIIISGSHNVFNPVLWQQKRDGTLVKVVTGNEVGPGALKPIQLTPLYLIVTFEGVTEAENPRYKIGIERQASTKISERRKTVRTVNLNEKNDIFTLKQVKPPKEDPSAVVIQMNEDKELITVPKEEPFKKVAGYAVDLKYPPDNDKVFPGLRVGAPLNLSGDLYKIVAITQNDVTVQANSNSKRTVIPVTSAP